MRAREWMSIVVVAAAMTAGADGKGAYMLIARVPIDQWTAAKK